MSAEHNKQIITDVYEALSKGETAPFVEAMQEDYTFRPMGASRRGVWGAVYAGKTNVIENFYRPWAAQTENGIRIAPVNVFADGDHVIVEGKGNARMKSGEPYNQDYCLVIRMQDGKMLEVREYFDTGLSDALFEKV